VPHLRRFLGLAALITLTAMILGARIEIDVLEQAAATAESKTYLHVKVTMPSPRAYACNDLSTSTTRPD